MNMLELLLIGLLGVLCGAILATVMKNKKAQKLDDQKFQDYLEALKKTRRKE